MWQPEVHVEGISGAVTGFFDRVRSGDLGMLPVVVGLIVISVVFSSLNPDVSRAKQSGQPAVDALKQGSDAFAEMRRLAMRFKGILRSSKPGLLDGWIDDAIDSELIPIMRFARVLRRDIDAVNNAIELPWSNGQAEGQVNRLKTLKHAMYGRAGPELLRARMLPPRHTN